jgi:hypothetical protein
MDHADMVEQPGQPSESGPVERNPSSSRPAPTNPAPPTSFILAFGLVEPQFSSLALEREFTQATGRSATEGLTDRQVFQSVLAERANRYLARQLCWTFKIQGLVTYLLVPRDQLDVELLLEAVRADPRPSDVDMLVGVRGPIAPPEACNGLTVPMVAVDKLHSFDRDEFINAIPRPEMPRTEKEEQAEPARRRGRGRTSGEGAAPEEGEDEDRQFRATAEELFDRILQMADNAGATDEDRACNYLLTYPEVYRQTAEAYAAESSLSAVEARPSRLTGTRKVMDVIFSYTHRRTGVTEKYYVAVDVTEEYPFLVKPLSPYYERWS